MCSFCSPCQPLTTLMMTMQPSVSNTNDTQTLIFFVDQESDGRQWWAVSTMIFFVRSLQTIILMVCSGLLVSALTLIMLAMMWQCDQDQARQSGNTVTFYTTNLPTLIDFLMENIVWQINFLKGNFLFPLSDFSEYLPSKLQLHKSKFVY